MQFTFTTTISEGPFHIPDELRQANQWICYGIDGDRKKPYAPFPDSRGNVFHTGTRSPENFRDFQTAIEFVEERESLDGVGFVLSGEDVEESYFLVDFDDVLTTDGRGEYSVSREVVDLLDELADDAFLEISSSSEGIHAIVRGNGLDEDLRQKGAAIGDGELELYGESPRFVAMTGRTIEGYEDTSIGQFDTLSLQQRHFEEKESHSSNEVKEVDVAAPSSDSPSVEEVRRTAFEYSDKFRRLWKGDDSMHGGDTSSADSAFVTMLAFWCRGDAGLMDRCVRQSRRMRRKWDEVHYADGSTYGERLLQKGIDWADDEFAGSYR